MVSYVKITILKVVLILPFLVTTLYGGQETEDFYVHFLRKLARDLEWSENIFVSESGGGRIYGIASVPFQRLGQIPEKELIYFITFNDSDSSTNQLEKNLKIYEKFCFQTLPFTIINIPFYRTFAQLYTSDKETIIKLDFSYDIIEGVIGKDVIICRIEKSGLNTNAIPLFKRLIHLLQVNNYSGIKKMRKKARIKVPEIEKGQQKPKTINLTDFIPEMSIFPGGKKTWTGYRVTLDEMPYASVGSIVMHYRPVNNATYEDAECAVEIIAYPSCGEPKIKVQEDSPKGLEEKTIKSISPGAKVFIDKKRNRITILFARENVFIKVVGAVPSADLLENLEELEKNLAINIDDKIDQIFRK